MRRPRFIAEQARHANGILGRVIAYIMERETWAENTRAIDALDLQPTDRILDVGSGHGRSLGELARRAPNGHVAGVDPSQLMAEIASQRHATLIRAGRVSVAIGTADDLPFPDASFNKVLCVHVLYFWKDLGKAARGIARVLRPGGQVALVFRSQQHKAAVEAFPADVYTFPTLAEVEAALKEAGFETRVAATQAPTQPHLVLATHKTSS